MAWAPRLLWCWWLAWWRSCEAVLQKTGARLTGPLLHEDAIPRSLSLFWLSVFFLNEFMHHDCTDLMTHPVNNAASCACSSQWC